MKLLLAATLFFVSCAIRQHDASDCGVGNDAMPVCSLVANAAALDGHEVLVVGLRQNQSHGTILFSRDCSVPAPKQTVNLTFAVDQPNDAELAETELFKHDQHRVIEMAVRGVFAVADEGECFGGGCERFEITDARILCVRPEERSRRAGTDLGYTFKGRRASD